jgi:uncharacterized protein YabN with tetrapyrrole methylase and pyrophosphatase domain
MINYICIKGTFYIFNLYDQLDNTKPTKKGSLLIVGSGIQAIRQFTLGSRDAVEQADKVLYLIPDEISKTWIKKINPNAESLLDCYAQGKPRSDSYKEMTERTLTYVRQGLNVCVIYYGHPGVFVNPSHESIRRARAEGFSARMLPGVSAEDCLFSDLGIDPSTRGCQNFEATYFLLHTPRFDTSSHLILWQIGMIGDFTYNLNRDNKPSLTVLADFLKKYYDPNHEVFIYEASLYVICEPFIQRLPLSKLPDAYNNYHSTLYIPPKITKTAESLDYDMAFKLGLRPELKPTSFHFSIKKLFHLAGK